MVCTCVASSDEDETNGLCGSGLSPRRCLLARPGVAPRWGWCMGAVGVRALLAMAWWHARGHDGVAASKPSSAVKPGAPRMFDGALAPPSCRHPEIRRATRGQPKMSTARVRPQFAACSRTLRDFTEKALTARGSQVFAAIVPSERQFLRDECPKIRRPGSDRGRAGAASCRPPVPRLWRVARCRDTPSGTRRVARCEQDRLGSRARGRVILREPLQRKSLSGDRPQPRAGDQTWR
jgi:hypothetical protein